MIRVILVCKDPMGRKETQESAEVQGELENLVLQAMMEYLLVSINQSVPYIILFLYFRELMVEMAQLEFQEMMDCQEMM